MATPLIVVSARAPFTPAGGKHTRSPGGVISALLPLLRRTRGVWFATGADTPASACSEEGFEVRPIDFPDAQRAAWYANAANGAIWPLAHGFVERCRFRAVDWAAYVEVCRATAASIAEAASPGALVWIHDYQLALVPALLRERRTDLRIGFFWHIPWPPAEILRISPWATALMKGMLGADLVGLQLPRYVRAFGDALESAQIEHGRASESRLDVQVDGKRRHIAAHPIGVDTDSWAALGEARDVAQEALEIRRGLGETRILLAVDRLDYSKGCVERLEAYERAIETHPALLDGATLVQIGVPSRESIGDYRALRQRVEETVGRINGRFATATRVPARFFATCFEAASLAAFYSAADVALVTPLRDGMNLVASEYVATRRGRGGRLVLSTTAGAADVLTEAHLVNPYDRDAFAETIAAVATMPETSADAARMDASFCRVAQGNVHAWVDAFLADLAAPEAARGARPTAAKGSAPRSARAEGRPVRGASTRRRTSSTASPRPSTHRRTG